MVTLDQIQQLHVELANAKSLVLYLLALRQIGVVDCTSYLHDGHSEYHCADGRLLVSEAAHADFVVTDEVDKKHMLTTLDLAEKGEIGYVEMSKRLAHSGVERWQFNTAELTLAYIDKSGRVLLHEQL